MRILITTVVTTTVGCTAAVPTDSQMQIRSTTGAKSVQKIDQASASQITVNGSNLTFLPETCVRGQAGFGWGLGSVQVNVHGRDHGLCIFDYTHEVEGGFLVYRCQVPAKGPPVRIHEDNGRIVTSFSLDEAKRIRSGNVHSGADEDAEAPVVMEQQPVAETGYVNYYADVVDGRGLMAAEGNHVVIDYTCYVDGSFTTLYPDFQRNRTLEFKLGQQEVGRGMETAVAGLKVGGKRRVRIREEVAPEICRQLGGVQPGSVLAVEIELKEIK